MILLEHDNRFNVFGDEFIFYDFAQPLKLPGTSPFILLTIPLPPLPLFHHIPHMSSLMV